MRYTDSNQLRRLILPTVLLAMLACNFLQGPVASPPPAPENAITPVIIPTVSQDQTPTTGLVIDKPDPLDNLLDLRSIQFKLIALYPDGTAHSTQAEVDAAGNMHLNFIIPDLKVSAPPEGFEMPAGSPNQEVYVVNGIGYQPDGESDNWISLSTSIDYLETLSGRLHGPNGPGLWLDLLPEGSLQSAGQETVGGFTTNKYAVTGTVLDQTITGNLWVDQGSHALVQVELHVPAALLNIPAKPTQGELKITLETQKADVSDITVPTAPTP